MFGAMSWQWWLAVLTVVGGIVLVVGMWVREWYHNDREDTTEADNEWADTLHGVTRELKIASELEDTGAIDMTWLRTHLDLEDIEQTLHEGLTAITDEIIRELNDDRLWWSLTEDGYVSVNV